MKNYIDVKVTVWYRYHFTELANMPGIVDLIKENGLEEAIDENLGFTETEMLPVTEEKLTPAENGNRSTIDVFENGQEIWNNEIK
ncbi:MAG: hypothetical protein QM764_20390 [Chitinophagaceae bacterium]